MAQARKTVATAIVTRLKARVKAIKDDRASNAASINAIQAATTVNQLRGEVVRMQRELNRVRLGVIDHDRLMMLGHGEDDGSDGDDPNV